MGMENVASVRFVIAVSKLFISIEVVLNLKIFIITYFMPVDYYYRIVIAILRR